MSKIKVGQIYKPNEEEIFCITNVCENGLSIIYSDGVAASIKRMYLEKYTWLKNALIAEYPTWQEAVNSKEFNNVAED